MYDYIICGAGPAGSVLAYRLSQDRACSVLLLEAGPKDSHPFIHMPKGMGKIVSNPRYLWYFNAQEKAQSNKPPNVWIRGKCLGGSSSVNGLIYVRGQPPDYDELARQTSDDWNWQRIGTAFRELESHELGPAETRGTNGPLRVSMPTDHDELMEAAIEAAEVLGNERQEDVNTPDDRAKVGYSPRTIFKGRRQNASTAFLRNASSRPNLTIKTNALVERVLFKGARATGVEVRVVGRTERFEGKTIILSSGTLATPAILQRSGVGPEALLRRHGISVVHASPGVGQNLREQPALNAQWRLKKPVSQNLEYHGLRLVANALKYYGTRRGPLANATFEVCAWVKSRPGLQRPNAQFLITPLTFDFTAPDMATERHHAMQAGCYILRPRSTGSVDIQSNDAAQMPLVTLDFFAEPEDRRETIESFRYLRSLFRQKPLAEYIDVETRPGPSYATDDEIIEAFRTFGSPAYHAVGTCRMGSDADSVVDTHTNVRGTENLKVVDLSIAPFVVAGNTYGPTAALAWRAADMMLGAA